MTVGAILTLGLGAFSDVNHVVTLGYGTGATPVIPPPPGVQTGGGRPVKGHRRPHRQRFILPDDTIVLATLAEVEELLEQFVVPEAKAKPKRGRRHILKPEERLQPEEIRWEPVPDVEIETFRPVLPPLMVWSPVKAKLETALRAMRRRLDDEEAMLVLDL